MIDYQYHPTDEKGICLDRYNLRLLNSYIIQLEEGYR